MNKTFNREKALAAGHSQEAIDKFLEQQQPKKFNREKALAAGHSEEEIDKFLKDEKKNKNEPITAKGAFGSYLTGAMGGVAGAVPNVINLVSENKRPAEFEFEEGKFFPTGFKKQKEENTPAHLPGSTEFKQKAEKSLGVTPSNALERVLSHSGEFGGMEAEFGAIGGPVGAAVGLAHGSASGAIYGGLLEAGVPENWALGATIVLGASPIAARKLWTKLKPSFEKGKTFNEALQESDIPKNQVKEIQWKEAEQAASEPELTASPDFLKSDFEIAENVKTALSPLRVEGPKTVEAPRTVNTFLAPIAPVLDAMTPNRVMDSQRLGTNTRDMVNQAFDIEYAHEGSLWDEAKARAAETTEERPGLVTALQEIIAESPPPVRGGEAKSVSFAEDSLRRLQKGKGKRAKYLPISNRMLIGMIQNARKNYNYKYQGGVESHQINQFIRAVEEELEASAGEAERESLLEARQATRKRATLFNNPQILPYRQKHVNKPRQLYEQSLSPDTYQVLAPILQRSPQGQILAKQLKRNMVEKNLEPFLLNPQSINPLKFQRTMGKLQGIVTPEESKALTNSIEEHHQKSLQGSPGKTKGKKIWELSETQIASKLKTIEGLRELKKDLISVGREDLYHQIARTHGIDLLFGGQMSIPVRAENIAKQLNDRNGRFYIKETLGEGNLNILDELAKENKLEKRLKQIEGEKESSQILKYATIAGEGVGLISALLKGRPITAIKKAYKLHDTIKKKPETPTTPREGIEIT